MDMKEVRTCLCFVTSVHFLTRQPLFRVMSGYSRAVTSESRNDPVKHTRSPATPACRWKSTMQAHFERMHDLGIRLTGLLAVGLGLDPNFFAKYFSKSMAALRLLHYSSEVLEWLISSDLVSIGHFSRFLALEALGMPRPYFGTNIPAGLHAVYPHAMAEQQLLFVCTILSDSILESFGKNPISFQSQSGRTSESKVLKLQSGSSEVYSRS